MKTHLISAALALVFGFLGAAAWSFSGMADARTKTYLLENPQLLPQMAEAYQAQEASDRLANLGDDLYEPFPGAVLGNPSGSKVLVEFTDYNCPYCRSSEADVKRLIADDPEVKVVIREMPIFQGSEGAARMALAAAGQGKFAQFHEAMFRLGPATPETVEEAARDAGLDLEQARSAAASEEVTAELVRNSALANRLGFTGTPSWVTRKRAFEGAIGYSALKTALDENR